MNTILLLKLLIVPALIALVTLAGRRWGPAVAGWLSAFPVVAGPILWFIALEQGAAFAAQAAVGTLSAVLGMLAFGLSYAWAATRFPWPLSLPLAYAGYALAVLLLEWWNAPLPAAVAGVLLGLWLVPRFYPRLQAAAAAPSKPPRDMLLRMALGALLVLGVTYSAAQLGPSLSGILAMFPVMGTVLVLFTHRSAGAAAAVQLLRGMVLGFYAFGTFCAVLAWSLSVTGVGMAFLWALAVAAVVQGLSRLWLIRHGALAPVR
ncbi:MAG: hypothetical protein KIT13_08570 [Burkholderiales bacterium]|nr:hypothetical protein [Burkholderiales bacterium]MCW5616993.1 hypothetical protein [Rhodocyclaceae bacterium]